MLFFDGWIVTMLKKPQNCPISDFFDLTPKYFLPLLPYTDLVPPSTDPVPPSTNHYGPILTQYHHVSTGNVALGLETSAQFTPALVFGEITDPPPRDSTILLLLMLVSVSCGMELSKQTSTLLLAPG